MNPPIRDIETAWIPMTDGTRLAARLWLPESAEVDPVPAILEYIPYRRRDMMRMRDEGMHPRFAAAGYAAVRVDIRGSGDSEGFLEDEYLRLEQDDALEVIAWIVAQPWCDGKVGMMGKSWGAYAALQVAARRPPALRAILPVMGTDDRFAECIHFSGGVLLTDDFWWACIMQVLNALPPDPDVVGERWREMWRERLTRQDFWSARWLRHQRRDDFWRHGSVSTDYAAIQVPVYFVGGWADSYRDSPFRLAANLPAPIKVLMGPWAHLYPHEGVPGPAIDFIGEALRWWDHWLKGIDTGLLDEPRLRVHMPEARRPDAARTDTPGRWVEEPAWPSPNVAARRFHLNRSGLGAAPEAGDALTIRSPQGNGIATGDLCSFAIPGDMPGDQRADAGFGLDFRTAALSETIEILGNAEVRLRVASDRPQARLAAVLIDEWPDGAQTLICRGLKNLNHFRGDDDPAALVPGEPVEVRVRLHSVAYSLPPGHRLLLRLTCACWPIAWPAPAAAELSMAAGGSTLDLPVRNSVGGPEPRPLPAPAPAAPAPLRTLREGRLERTATIDAVTGRASHRVFIDGGVFGPTGVRLLEEIGLEMGHISDRTYSIDPADPLSATAEMSQRYHLARGDWRIDVVTSARMEATASDFHLTAHVEAYEGETLFERVEWTHRVPRSFM